jgi:ElaB/YqjD/DUF883 family membrane-anchored ribosome-binding protein
MATDTTEKAHKQIDKTADKACDAADQAKDRLHQTYDKANETVQHYFEATCDYIKKHPIKSVGIAALIGTTLASIINSRK